MRRPSLVILGVLMSCMAAAAFAQTSVDRSFKATSKDCSDVQWSDTALQTYPTIASACQGVQQREGKSYVKFRGNVERNIDRGKQLEVDFKDGGLIKLTPPPNTVLYVNGRKTPVADLQRGDELNFYIAEDRLAAQFPADETDTPQTQYVMVPIVYHEVTHQQASLPKTGSDLPLVALSGILMLGLGAGLTVYRRRG